MPYMDEIQHITGYFHESLEPSSPDQGPQKISDGMGDLIREWIGHKERWPIRNREERTPINPQKRAIIHARDHDHCAYCPRWDVLNIDHIVPRTAFWIWDLHIADRSDNLISVCRTCNEEKSNFEHPQRKRPGVVIACWECLNPWYDPDDYEDEGNDPQPHMKIPAFCGRHGAMTMVPEIKGWII